MFNFYKKFSEICGENFEKCDFNPEDSFKKLLD